MGVHESNRGLCEALEDFYEHCLREIRNTEDGSIQGSLVVWGHELGAANGQVEECDQQNIQRGISKRTQRTLKYEPGCARIWQMLIDRGCLQRDA